MTKLIIVNDNSRGVEHILQGDVVAADWFCIDNEEYEFIKAAHETFKAKRAEKSRNREQISHLGFTEIDRNYYTIVTRFGSMANYYASRANIDYASKMFRK